MRDLQTEIDKDRATCMAILSTGAGLFHWAWDSHSSAYLAKIGTENAEAALETLGQQFSERWSTAELARATRRTKSAIAKLGGLREGQVLFTHTLAGPAFLFCAWWPWNNGMTVSVRIGYYTDGMENSDADSLLAQFRKWFGE